MKSFIYKNNLCAVVVWYNPTVEIAQNILRYAEHVNQIFVIDNLDQNNQLLLSNLAIVNAVYHFMGGNKGIVAALNVGFMYAADYKVKWVLTMDQDSIFEDDSFENYLREVNDYMAHETVGIFSIIHDFGQIKENKRHIYDRYCEKKRVMCSGNIVSLKAYHTVGHYREDFFMDLVDLEFCARIVAANYRIIEYIKIRLKHFLGEKIMTVAFFGYKKYIPDYPLWKKYYLVRNMRITANTHKLLRYSMACRFLQEIKETVLFDYSPKKWKKNRGNVFCC